MQPPPRGERWPRLKRWLAVGPTDTGARVDKVEFMDYRDTKIMYHFTHFRVLPTRRLTCFEDGGPHGGARYEPALRDGVYDGLDPLGTDPRADPLPAPGAGAVGRAVTGRGKWAGAGAGGRAVNAQARARAVAL